MVQLQAMQDKLLTNNINCFIVQNSLPDVSISFFNDDNRDQK